MVTQSGFSLLYQVFAGNAFEGKTMLPTVETFIATHPQTRPIIVADTAMLDEERLAELREKELSYIVGTRLANADIGLVQQIHATLKGKHGTIARFPSRHGDLVCDFSLKRYKKELNGAKQACPKSQRSGGKEAVPESESTIYKEGYQRKNRAQCSTDRKKEAVTWDQGVMYRLIRITTAQRNGHRPLSPALAH